MMLQRYTRWQAAPFHLGISAVIAAAVLSAMVLVWYPSPYFQAAGGRMLLLLLIGVDVVVGPLLTLIVYDPRKKHLAIDLALIGALQLAALAYGGWIMFNARPAYVAFAGDRFELVAANAIDPSDLDKAAPSFRRLPLTGPQIVGTRLPANDGEMDTLRQAAMLGGSIGLFPQHYVPYATQARSALARSKPLATLRRMHPEAAAEIDRAVSASGKPEAALRYLPLQARHGDLTVFINAADGSVVGVVAVDPW